MIRVLKVYHGSLLHYETSVSAEQLLSLFIGTHNLLHCRNSIQQSCPFCRESLSKVKPDDLWVYTDDRDIVDLAKVTTDDLKRLYLYIDKLPSMGGPSANTVLNVDDSLEKSSSTNRLILSTNLN
ncbi:hypothetical protein M5K25_026273 [Dendrobium thyrsiflorum]|uniref:Uncharacterized protein n=1 Tax=Dendrobium thyrsiflorum TaxID=117978 RepID=A0ABD0TX86_DENTH